MYRLMIIDDEYMIHLSLRKLVETSGLDIIITGEAEDGEEALELLDGSCPDIVVTDIRMPKMDGLAFIGAAQQRRNGMRFIILSGYDHFEYAQQAIRYGVSNFLLKPVDPDQFLESLSIVYEQLKRDEDRLIRRGDWLVKYQELAKELASAIWSTDQTEALAVLSRVFLHYEERGAEELAFARYASGLIGSVEKNLNDRSFALSESRRDVSGWPAREDLCVAYLESAVTSMISEIKGSRNLGARHKMLKATEFIKEHYADEELSLPRVAAELGMSVAYLSRSFKEEMNINFVKYLVQTRLEKAAELLERDTSPAVDIAYQVGFTDYSHFSRTFKKHFGLTPAEYRKSGFRHA